MPTNPTPNRNNQPDFWTGRGHRAVVRVHGNEQPIRLRGRRRSDWMVR